ncbi:DUF3060 domain-containing protein [Myxococcota bacterium]|nr:DUF3060 domain-containing protein [Myxococcota bacterium]
MALGLGATASAADPTKVKIGKGGVSVEAGGTKVDVSGGDVGVETDGADVEVDADEDEGGEVAKGAAELEIVGNGKKVEHTCGGASKGATNVSITGNGHKVVLKGACATVTVTGNNHDVAIDEVAAILATGNSLKVTWKKAAVGKEPKITRTGNGVSVKKLDK